MTQMQLTIAQGLDSNQADWLFSTSQTVTNETISEERFEMLLEDLINKTVVLMPIACIVVWALAYIQ